MTRMRKGAVQIMLEILELSVSGSLKTQIIFNYDLKI
jgi:predicted transcriptional regulator